MQPWENQRGTDGHHLRRGLDARRRGIFLDCALLLDGPYRFLVSRLMVRRAGPGRADVFDLLRGAAHGTCRSGPGKWT